jgi:hypothetical protein
MSRPTQGRALLVLGLAVLAVAGGGAPSMAGTASEEAIYRALLENRAAATTGDRVLLVGSRATLRSPFGTMDRRQFRALLADAGAPSDLLEKTNQVSGSTPGPRSGTLQRGQRRVDSGEIERIFDDAPSPEVGWSRLYERYPTASGYLHFSPVVFSDDGDRAGVVETFVCGVDCGDTRILLLEEGIEGWVVMAEVRVP